MIRLRRGVARMAEAFVEEGEEGADDSEEEEEEEVLFDQG